MKNNIKLFFKSLFSNNTAIDAARKKPWYAAVILFFISIVISCVPATVLQLKKHADKNFIGNANGADNTYLAAEATTQFAKYLQDDKFKETMYVFKEDKKSVLAVNKDIYFEYRNQDKNNELEFVFDYASDDEAAEAKSNSYLDAETGIKASFFIFTPESVYICILDPNTHDMANPVLTLGCNKAYKKIGENQIKESLVVGENDAETIEKTWENWKILIKKFHNHKRLESAGWNLLLIGGINIVITLVMGFMVWVLTRGKNNPYRMFTVWESFKIAFWSAMCPALLTCGFGFLIKSFAQTLFALLLGVRVMWLSMKSLRPDGSGYAAN